MTESQIAGRVIGAEDATPLEFWVAIAEGQFLQLDDVVALERKLPNGETVRIFPFPSWATRRSETGHPEASDRRPAKSPPIRSKG
ncbi:MAG: hypothetical protein ACRD1Z_11020 [Vicinamibacteria bacterium]